jgi:hypothetical protein
MVPPAFAIAHLASPKREARHCEERSDEAIQNGAPGWIASLRSQ